jgi:hypothetical protein
MSRLECVPLTWRGIGVPFVVRSAQIVERNIWLLSCLPSCTYSRFTVQRHHFVMRCVFSYSGAPSFARLGHNRSHRTRPQPQTAHRYHGSLTHLRDPAPPGRRPSSCIHRTHRRFFSHTTGPAAQAHQLNILRYKQSAIHTMQSPPVLH